MSTYAPVNQGWRRLVPCCSLDEIGSVQGSTSFPGKRRGVPRVRISTMGGFAVSIDGCRQTPPNTRIARALFACLALEPGCRLAREVLIERFWPEVAPERGRANLATALWAIRRALEPQAAGLLHATRTTVMLEGEIQIDVADFENDRRSSDVARRMQAMQTYRGDFLPENTDSWSVAQRERLSMLYESMLSAELRDGRDPDTAWKVLERDPFAEHAYEVLIDRALETGNQSAARSLLVRWKAVLGELHSPVTATYEERAFAIAALQATMDPVATATSIRSLTQAGERGAAIDVYGRYQRAVRARGAEPDESVIAAFHDALWSAAPEETENARFVLPRPALRFIGRESDLRLLTEAVRAGTATTVTGVAGVGKTRLAIRAAELLAPRFGGGVRYLEVASHERATIAAAMSALLASVGAKASVLIVVDNVEHVADTLADIVRAEAERHPTCAFLLTSRAKIDRLGPTIAVEPLDLPLAIDAPALYVHSPAVGFFAERAVAARPSLMLDNETLVQVAAICRILDGIPLALEMAAAQLRYLVPGEVLRRFTSHRQAHGDALLRDQIGASFALLSEPDRQLARRLAVYDRRFTIGEAEAIGGSCAFDTIVRLVDLSLVQVEELAGETLYRYLETTYTYAREQFERLEDREGWERRALVCTRDAIVEAIGDGAGAPTASAIAYLRLRLPNVRRALDVWSAQDAFVALEIALATRLFWQDEGVQQEAVDRLTRLSASMPHLPTGMRYAVKRAIGAHLVKMQELAAGRQALHEALAIVEEAADHDAVRECILELAVAAYEGADYAEARALLLRAVESAPASSEQWGQVNSFLANVAIAIGDFAEAERRFESIADLERAPTRQANFLRNRAYAAALAGDSERAAVLGDAALEAAVNPAVGAPHRASVYAAVGFAQTQRGDPHGALAWFVRSVIELADTSAALHTMYIVEDASCALGALGRHEDAVMLLAAVARERERAGTPVDPSARAILETTIADARATLPKSVFSRAELRGSLLSVQAAAEHFLAVVAELSDGAIALGLSARETAIARLIGEGATNSAIGQRLSISVKTVENHVGSIFRKLQVSRRSQVATLISRL